MPLRSRRTVGNDFSARTEQAPACRMRLIAEHPTALLEGASMLRWAIAFLVIALIAALFGFGLLAGMAYDAAKVLFFVFIVLAVLSFLGGFFYRSAPPV
jgi:uncharacterized membrane protein YtjA (UPF0391 family)